jgi:hypothetical protein
MVALSGLTLLVIVCQCGMLTLVLVCLGVRAECNWAKSSQQAASLRFCVCCWRTPFAFVRCWGRCACALWVCHLGCFSLPRMGVYVTECCGVVYFPHTMWMGCPMPTR